jgi:hypothetical protein
MVYSRCIITYFLSLFIIGKLGRCKIKPQMSSLRGRSWGWMTACTDWESGLSVLISFLLLWQILERNDLKVGKILFWLVGSEIFGPWSIGPTAHGSVVRQTIMVDRVQRQTYSPQGHWEAERDRQGQGKLSLFFFFCSVGVWTQGLHLEPLHQPFFVKVFFEIETGSLELFPWAGLETRSSWSLPPE